MPKIDSSIKQQFDKLIKEQRKFDALICEYTKEAHTFKDIQNLREHNIKLANKYLKEKTKVGKKIEDISKTQLDSFNRVYGQHIKDITEKLTKLEESLKKQILKMRPSSDWRLNDAYVATSEILKLIRMVNDTKKPVGVRAKASMDFTDLSENLAQLLEPMASNKKYSAIPIRKTLNSLMGIDDKFYKRFNDVIKNKKVLNIIHTDSKPEEAIVLEVYIQYCMIFPLNSKDSYQKKFAKSIIKGIIEDNYRQCRTFWNALLLRAVNDYKLKTDPEINELSNDLIQTMINFSLLNENLEISKKQFDAFSPKGKLDHIKSTVSLFNKMSKSAFLKNDPALYNKFYQETLRRSANLELYYLLSNRNELNLKNYKTMNRLNYVL